MLFIFKKWSHRGINAAIRDSSIKMQLQNLLVSLFLILLVHTFLMMHFEQLSFVDAAWLTVTSATTVGYGDYAAQTLMGRISTIVLLYIMGIALLAQSAAMYFEYRQEVRNRILTGQWSWKMKDHIVFLNCPHELGQDYFYQAILGLRKSNSSIAQRPIIIVSDSLEKGISDELRKLDVVHVSKPLSNNSTLEDASIRDAHTILLLAPDLLDPTSDSINFDLVYRLREMGVKGRVIVESVKDDNRIRLRKIGADNVLRPIRTYPELLMRTIIAPGSEQVIETLFNSRGEECIRYEVDVNCRWIEIIQQFAARDFGLPIAFEDHDGRIINSPSSRSEVKTRAIFAIVKEHNIQANNEIVQMLKSAEKSPLDFKWC